MKKYLLLVILSILCIQELHASHTKGGWMYYEYLGPGINDPTKLRYKIGLNLYIDCGSSTIEATWNFSFFSGRAPYNFIQDVAVSAAPAYTVNGCVLPGCYPCINNIPARCYKIINYETIVELAATPEGYIVSKQRCCRVASISNLQNPSTNFGATFTIKIPGLLEAPTAPLNSSPFFIFKDTAVVCGSNQFSLDFTATDADGDSLSYSFVDAYSGGSQGDPNPGTSAPPPYTNVVYSPPYSGVNPLGVGVTINPVTGLISGIAPPNGEYVICVLVREYRNGSYIGEARKELHLKTTPCTPLTATANFVPITCDGFTVTFNQSSTGSPDTYFWDFGDPASGANNNSNLPSPTHTFTDTGVYQIKLRVSIGGLCVDSVISPIRVFPGFLPGFTSSPKCINVPVQFQDTTYSAYGTVNSWRWDFGDPSTLADTSHLQAPIYTYPTAGTYTVELRVTNTKGCDKIYTKTITIFDNPVVTLFPRDTAYCGRDSLQLTAGGTGSFSWSPGTNITGGNTATPKVYPTTPTRYVVTLTSTDGCMSKDSLLVTPKLDLTNAIAANPAAICEEDTLQLSGTSNYSNNISWQWSPSASLENPTQQNTRAFPIVNTTYTLTTTWGANCVANATKAIAVKALAVPNAGPDVSLCNGQPSTQLNASGGDTYQWSPATGLSNAGIRNPIASPTTTTTYVVSVGVNGCSKKRDDSVIVYVTAVPPLTHTNDTLICTIDTLQLNSSGTGNFTWTPNYMISSTTVSNPLVSPDVPTKYYVRLTDALGCFRDDSIFVDVRSAVSLSAAADTTICSTDTLFLNIVSDGLHYKWTPATYLDYDTVKRPRAVPSGTITYTVEASIGKCKSIDDIKVKVVPYPLPAAGPDIPICPGFSAQLQASGGSIYAWSPSTFLTDTKIPNPRSLNPAASIQYIVTVRDTLGCPKPVKDTVWVIVHPKTVADAGPRDTSVVVNEPLFLQATGGVNYSWNPGLWLSDPNISNPVALPKDNINYVVTVTTADGCIGKDTIRVKLYNMDPDLYVPTAFSPDGDGTNDVLRPILLGMKQLNSFRVFDRWGRLMFYTTEQNKGWDGRFNGKAQDPGTFVWMAEGINYKGELKKKKGYSILIR